VPEPGNPQSLNRYTYVGNSPLGATDPSGHMELNEGDAYQEPYSPYWDCYTNPSGSACQVTPEQELEAFGFAFVGLFSVGLGGIVLTDLAAIPATQVIGGRLLKAGAEELVVRQT